MNKHKSFGFLIENRETENRNFSVSEPKFSVSERLVFNTEIIKIIVVKKLHFFFKNTTTFAIMNNKN